MDKRYDAIVVGGGPGGLAVGALLSKDGYTTIVLEKGPQLGGRYRSIEFKGCRVDNGVHLLTGSVGSIEETFCKRLFKDLGLELKQKEVFWTMGLVGRPGQEGIEFFSIDRAKGVGNFFDFFAFGSGMEMEPETRGELKRIFEIMGKMTMEEKRALVGTTWTDWLDRNCKDPLVSMILSVHCQLSGFSSDDTAAGGIIGSYAPFHAAGAVPFWYPAEGTLQDAIIRPLETYIRESGGVTYTNSKVRRIDIEGGRVNGVWLRNTASDTIEKIEAPVVVSAVPLHQAAGPLGILDMDVFPEDWQETIRSYQHRADEDLTGFYLLKEKVIPEDYYGWIHLFDAAEGIPNYVGDWLKGEFTNARVPPGKQLVYTFITANNTLSPFGRESDLNMVEKALGCWEGAMEKAFPGFQEKIEYKTYTLQLNWGRFALGSVLAEIKVRCPTAKGLYFAGDSVHTVASLASDKVYEAAKYCEQAILEDRG
jgi:phytoene dehydrogenase-like protein